MRPAGSIKLWKRVFGYYLKVGKGDLKRYHDMRLHIYHTTRMDIKVKIHPFFLM